MSIYKDYFDIFSRFQLPKENVKQRDLSKIELKSNFIKPRKRYTKIKEVIGIDTETEKGKCFVLGYYKSIDKQAHGIIRTETFDDILELLTSKTFQKSQNFLWNLDYDIQAIIKTMSLKYFEEMARNLEIYYKYKGTEYHISYIRNKCFKISWGHKSIKLWDMQQYYGKMSLDNASKKYLNVEGKLSLKDFGINIKKLSFKRYKTDKKYRDIIDEYLLLDCKLTKDLSQIRIKAIRTMINPKDFYSQASIAQQYFLENLKETMFLPPNKAMQFALKGYQGGRFETIQRGHFDKSYIYDIKSAYPYHCKNVPNLSTGKWKINKEYDDNALVSLYKVSYNLPKMKITPTKQTNKQGILYFPYGKFKDVHINKTEYETLSKYTNVQINEAIHYNDNNPSYPYRFMEDFFYKKEQAKKDKEQDLALTYKTIINGFYGKTIQVVDTHDFVDKVPKDRKDDLLDTNLIKIGKHYKYKLRAYKAGILFNPVIANEITSNARIQLFNAAVKNEDKVIGMQTDSIILNSKTSNIKLGDKLGNWDLEDKGELLILGSGVYSIRGGRNKFRGFTKGMDLFELLEIPAHKLKEELKVKVTRNNKLKKIIKSKHDFPTLQDKYDNFNLIIDDFRTITLNFDRKREWNRPFKNVNDALKNQIKSSPIKL